MNATGGLGSQPLSSACSLPTALRRVWSLQQLNRVQSASVANRSKQIEQRHKVYSYMSLMLKSWGLIIPGFLTSWSLHQVSHTHERFLGLRRILSAAQNRVLQVQRGQGLGQDGKTGRGLWEHLWRLCWDSQFHETGTQFNWRSRDVSTGFSTPCLLECATNSTKCQNQMNMPVEIQLNWPPDRR